MFGESEAAFGQAGTFANDGEPGTQRLSRSQRGDARACSEGRAADRLQAQQSCARLATGKAKSIGLVMQSAPEIGGDPHFSEFLGGLAEEAVKHDFHFVMAPPSPDDEVNAIKRLIASGYVDAIFLAHIVDPDPRVELLRSSSIPYLLHGRIMGGRMTIPISMSITKARSIPPRSSCCSSATSGSHC